MSETLNILMELLNEYRLSECALDEGRVSWYAARLDGRTEDERMDERMSITDKLRKWVNERFVGLFSSEWVSDLNAIADRIDVEYAAYRAAVSAIPKEYVKLPVDADGVPIHVGDEVAWGDGEAFEVMGFGGIYTERAFYLNEGGRFCWGIAENCHHVKPDSWERIIEDAMQDEAVWFHTHEEWQKYHDQRLAELVERCRRLAGEGA